MTPSRSSDNHAAPGPERPLWPFLLAGLGLIAAQALVLYAMGRTPICTCDTIRLWVGNVRSSENSQQLFDWYTLSHILHGFVFYLVLWLLFPRKSFGARLLMAIAIEVSWEIVENTNLVIDRYRAETISLHYYGDSILNSVTDTLAATAGFIIAHRAPVALVVAAALAVEIGMAFWIRDNLTLNVLMLLYPIDAIQHWQNALAPK